MTGDVSTISSPGVRAVSVRKPDGEVVSDLVAVEAPLEIRVGGRPLVITMRTPGHDEGLTSGSIFRHRRLIQEPFQKTLFSQMVQEKQE